MFKSIFDEAAVETASRTDNTQSSLQPLALSQASEGDANQEYSENIIMKLNKLYPELDAPTEEKMITFIYLENPVFDKKRSEEIMEYIKAPLCPKEEEDRFRAQLDLLTVHGDSAMAVKRITTALKVYKSASWLYLYRANLLLNSTITTMAPIQRDLELAIRLVDSGIDTQPIPYFYLEFHRVMRDYYLNNFKLKDALKSHQLFLLEVSPTERQAQTQEFMAKVIRGRNLTLDSNKRAYLNEILQNLGYEEKAEAMPLRIVQVTPLKQPNRLQQKLRESQAVKPHKELTSILEALALIDKDLNQYTEASKSLKKKTDLTKAQMSAVKLRKQWVSCQEELAVISDEMSKQGVSDFPVRSKNLKGHLEVLKKDLKEAADVQSTIISKTLFDEIDQEVKLEKAKQAKKDRKAEKKALEAAKVAKDLESKTQKQALTSLSPTSLAKISLTPPLPRVSSTTKMLENLQLQKKPKGEEQKQAAIEALAKEEEKKKKSELELAAKEVERQKQQTLEETEAQKHSQEKEKAKASIPLPPISPVLSVVEAVNNNNLQSDYDREVQLRNHYQELYERELRENQRLREQRRPRYRRNPGAAHSNHYQQPQWPVQQQPLWLSPEVYAYQMQMEMEMQLQQLQQLQYQQLTIPMVGMLPFGFYNQPYYPLEQQPYLPQDPNALNAIPGFNSTL